VRIVIIVLAIWMALMVGLAVAFRGGDEEASKTPSGQTVPTTTNAPTPGTPISPGTETEPGVDPSVDPGAIPPGQVHEAEPDEDTAPPLKVQTDAVAAAELSLLASRGYPALGHIPYRGQKIAVTASLNPNVRLPRPTLHVAFRGPRPVAARELAAFLKKQGDRLSNYDVAWKKS
jgi:hypothetical protein